MSGDPVFDALAGFLHRRRAAGDEGKTFLLGYRNGDACFAVAAGLRSEADRERFQLFARYLLRHRFDCNAHALLIPVELQGEAVYAVEFCRADVSREAVIDSACAWRECALPDGLIGDLRHRETALPGLMRRELDRLFEAVRVEP